MPKLLLKCRECGKEFESYPSQLRKYCSRLCLWNHHSQAAIQAGRGTANKPRRGQIKKCEVCGGKFYVEPRRINSALYCSRSCQNKGLEKAYEVHCHYCAKPFKTRPSEAQEYCSRECRVAWQRANQVKGACEVCSKPTRSLHNRFCSRACMKIGIRTGVIITCKTCDKPVYKVKSAVRRGYCSRACHIEGLKLKGPGAKVVRSDGYIEVYYPTHPNANHNGRVMEHRLIAEQMYGRPILSIEHVHHKNGQRADNRPENLVIISASDHAKLSIQQGMAKRKAMRDELEFLRDELEQYRRLYGPLKKMSDET